MWLGADCPCRCGWVADPVKEIDNDQCICKNCGAVYDKRDYGWSYRQKSFDERMKENEN